MRSIAAKLFLSLASLCLTFAGLEVVFRLLDYRGFHDERRIEWGDARLKEDERVTGVRYQYRPNSEFRFIYDSDPTGYFGEDNSIRVRINNHGHRGPDFDVPKPKGVYRIVVLGDSFTVGEGVKREHIFTTRVAEQLRERVSDRIEVVNAGTGGWDTSEEVRYLRARVLDWQPDLVLMVFVPNDANYVAGLDLWGRFRATYEPPDWLQKSYFLSFVYVRISREIIGQRYIELLVSKAVDVERRKVVRARWTKTLDAIREANDLLSSRGARFAIVVFPFMYQLHEDCPLLPVHDKVEAHARRLGIPFMDLLTAFLGEPYVDLWVHASDQHPNERGHAIAAEAITRFLIENRLVGEFAVRSP